MLLDGLDGVVHLLLRLPDREAADGVAREVELGYALHVLYAQVVENRALVYAEEHLAGVYGVRLGVILRKRALQRSSQRAVRAQDCLTYS